MTNSLNLLNDPVPAITAPAYTESDLEVWVVIEFGDKFLEIVLKVEMLPWF